MTTATPATLIFESLSKNNNITVYCIQHMRSGDDHSYCVQYLRSDDDHLHTVCIIFPATC